MKKYLFSLCMLLFLFTSVPVYAGEVEKLKGEAMVTVDSLNVRSGPSQSYEKIGTLNRDVIVQVKGIVEPDWYVIDFDGKDGYIHSDYVVFTPESEQEGGFHLVLRDYLVLVLGIGILAVVISMAYTYTKLRKGEEEPVGEEIPVTDHDDTNMHLGEVTYDTFRLDIDPKYFEKTSVLPQPEAIDAAMEQADWKEDIYREEIPAEAGEATLDSRLEQATAQLAALQKEVEELKKQSTDHN